MRTGIILSVFLSVCVWQTHGQTEQKLGDLTFVCKEGWRIYQSDCYMEVDVMMTWDDAKSTCQRQGGDLIWIKNEMEYDFVKTVTAEKTFWTGLQYVKDTNTSEWSHDHTAVNLKSIAVWGENEPNENGETRCAASQGEKLALKSCSLKQPFVCKYEACQKGYVPCATGGKCFMEQDKCDGRNDCDDMSDERDCRTSEYCSYYYKLSETLGNFQTARVDDGTWCSYVLEAPIGKQIKLTVPRLISTLEEGVATLEIWAGSPDIKDSDQLAELTGPVQEDDFISQNNFMTVLLRAGDLATSSRPGITLKWTTAIPEIFDGVREETATASWKSLTPTFTKERTPMETKLSWKIIAPSEEVIMYYLDSYDKSEGTSLRVQEGPMAEDPTRIMDPDSVKRVFYGSAANTIQVHWNSGYGMSSFNLQYKTGCNMEIDEAVGAFSVPIFWETSDRYPSNLKCEWVLTGGQAIGRGLTVHFILIDLDEDPRQDKASKDQIKLYNQTAEIASIGNSQSDGRYHAESGYMKVEFESDLMINEGVGFIAKFSVDCLPLNVSEWTIRSVDSVTSETRVTLSCQTGYKFDAEEYYGMAQVVLYCKEGGTWTYNDKADIRIPNCEVVQCGFPTEIQNGYILNATGATHGETAKYMCNDGFAISHIDPATCNENGIWQNRPTCGSATCAASDIQDIPNGDFEVEAGNNITSPSVDFNTVIKFVCDPGYELHGSLRSHCRHDGWSDRKPECHSIECPLPLRDNVLGSETSLKFGQSRDFSCKPGYGINGTGSTSVTVTCESNRMTMPPFECLDINECDSNPCDTTTTRCENNDGGHKCICLDGFESSGSTTSCSDIKECNVDKGGCSHTCNELVGSYECLCPSGWTLFIADGTSGFVVPNGESGYQFGDVYYYNHTCVKKSCDHPGNVAHGTLLSSKTLFHYQDSVELVCDDGYHITGSSETTTRMTRTCTDSGWSVENITCSARTCTTPSVPVRGSYDRDVVNFREKVTLTCKWTETENITRTAICLYDRGATRFVGHDITVCPAIDCGNPEDPLYLPSGGRVIGTVSTKHLDHETFTFDCLDGYTRLGTSEITDNQSVTCKENGRWSFGTLRCLGATCIDPGTPAEAKQLVVNYEVGKTLYYTCDRNGYVPVPDLNYTCEYNVGAGRAIWSDNLESNLPKCVDKTNPMIKNLPTATVYRDRMETANIPDPAYSDNFGVKSVTVSESIRSTDIIAESKTIYYTAEDYDNNVETVAVNIQVIDRTSKPSLNCPENLEVEVSSLASEVYNVTQHVTSDGTLQFSNETVTVSVDEIGTAERIDVTAKNEFGTESYCSFLVTFKAVKCFKDTLYPDSNAMRSCIGSGDGFTCSSKCNSGFVYGDGKDEKNFTCTGNNDWDVSYPHVFCLPTESPAYQFTAYVTHDYQYVNTPCLPDYEAAIRNRRSTFESQMRNLCSQIRWQILSETSSVGQSSSEFKSEFTVKLLDTDITEVERATCIESVRSTLEIFNLANNELYCTSAPGSFTIDTTNVAATNGSFECVTETYFLIDLDTGKKCIPCGPGRFYVDSNGGECTSCPAGQYQDQVDGSCKECDAGETGNTQGTDCIITCPAGFRSDDGLLPCAPCGVDKYWADSKTCTPCDSGTSTSGRKGAVDISGCYSSCPAGKYSRTGYEDWTCNACPRNFYQPNIGSTTCVECPDNQVTDDNSQNSSANCHDYNSFGAGESCNRAYCNDHGDCGFQFHRPVCTCDGGFTGERCDTSFDICNRNYNNFNPCMNDAECVPGTTYADFTCVCKEEVNRDLCFTESFPGKEGGSVGVLDYPTVNNLEQCQDACLARGDCLGVTYYIAGATICLLFNKTFSSGDLIDKAGRTHYNRDCPPVYDGARCENDLVNDCNNSRCSSDAMCKDEVLGYECLCPSEGGYQGTYCNQVEKPCTSNPCIHGSCHDFDYVRYECTCDAGYTGVNCDTDISDCDMNPNACPYGGTCSDRVNAYRCECPAMFSGENCENTPNYCESKYCLGNLCYNSLDDRSGKCECEGPYYIDSGLGDWACNSTAAQPCDFVTCINGTCDTQARCNCEAGFTGSQCQHSIDDCTDTSCSNNGRCIDEHMDFSCECPVGFTGSRCETNMDDCANQCGSHGNCVDGIDSYTCVCDPGYTGIQCETDINECLAYPCQHGGACNDSENKYICTCEAGWTGTNCEDWNEYCNPSPCKNDGVCYSLTGSRICRCGGGTQGEFCDNKTSVCDTLQHVPVCVNGGTCKDIGGTAECQCPIVPAMDRCFTTVHKDKEGGSDSLILPIYSNIDLEACKQKCLDNADCQSLSYHTIGSNKFCSIYSRKIPTTLVDEVGDVHIEKNCPTDYDGAACELAEDWCANNPCQNGGTCFTKDPRGFRCDCETGYSGAMCGVEADPCLENSCPSGATCRSTVTDYYCQCPMGREITGSTCRTTYEKTVLLLADAPDPAMDMVRRKRHSHGGGGTFYSVPEDIPTLKTPFRMSGGTFSVMFSIRIHKPKSAGVYNLLRLVGSDKLYPLRDENPKLVLLITNENVHLTYDMETVTLDLEEPLERAKWYHIGVALASNRELSYTIDAVEVSDPQPLPGASVLNFDDLNAQVVLGDTDMVAEFKLVTVWETALSNSEFAQASANEQYTPEGATLTQGWYNYNLPKTTKLLTQELKSDLYSEDKSVPSISCDNTPYERVSGDRILRRSSLTDLTSRINSVHGNGSVSMHSIPVDLTWGYYSAVVVVKANSRFAECRFPVYIKYNDQCPAPKDDSDVVITSCDNTDNDGVCGLKCSASSEYVSAPTPKYRACGVLGVYYWDKPYENLVLPTCAAGSSPRNVVEIFMQYDFKIDCGPFLDSEEIKAAVKKIFLSLNTSWSDICDGAGCTNLKFMKVECNSAMSKRLDLMFSLEFFSGTLTALRDEGGSLVNDGQMNLADALESIIVIEEKIDLSRFASAVLIKTSVMVTVKKDCTTFGYNLINNICVPCGKGLVYDDGLKRCVSCPRGKYKDMNDNECKSCGSEKTTVYVGSTSQDDCVDYCDAGRFYDTTRGSCQNCPRHAYQDKPGQSFCHPCELGYKTQGDGSSSPLDCKEDCPAGYDRNASGVCSVCERGYWRDLLADDCQQCDTGKTTIPGEIAISKDKCEMDVCPVGRFWNITVQDCMDCPAGKYQDEDAMLDCKPCDGNKTTKNPMADSASMCVFYCAAGYEVNPNETDACLPCKRGYYKDNMGSSKFDNCTQCVDSTTDDIAAESVNKCEYEICDRGQVLENKVCIDCDENFYQPILMVDSTARCIPCPEKAGTPQGTEEKATFYDTDCKPICPGGEQFDDAEMKCVECVMGTYKPDSDRFGNCMNCPENFTTDGNRKTSETECDIPLCARGDYVKDKFCTKCDYDTYQPDLHPAAGVVCTECPVRNGVKMGTKELGADSESYCKPVCPGGYEYDEDGDGCIECPVGRYKPDTHEDRFEPCYSCPAGFTNNGTRKLSNESCTIRDCPPGSYDDDTTCVLCPLGSYQDKPTKKKCEECGTNLNTSRMGANSSAECQAFCQAGEQSTTVSQERCEKCPLGKYKASPSYDPCQICPIDFTSNAERTACTEVFCSAGKEYKNLTSGPGCVPCQRGKYKDTAGNSDCKDCLPGKTTNETGQTSCEILHCKPGEYEVDGQCELCDKGYFKSEHGNDDCTPCAEDKTTEGKGADSEADCNIVICKIGEYREPTQTTACTPCPYNTYQNATGKTSCIDCPIDQVTMIESAKTAEDCVPKCMTGKQYNYIKKDCDPCPQRYYKDTVGNFQNCTECPSKKTTVGEGATAETQCNQNDCGPGSYIEVTNNAVTCPLCPVGKYQPESSQVQCESCGPTLTTLKTGSVSQTQCITECEAGNELIFPDTTKCHPCKIGKYNDLSGKNPYKCKPCPGGFTTTAEGKANCTVTVEKPTPAPVVLVRAVFLVVFRVETTCAELSLQIILSSIQNTFRIRMNTRRSRYGGICGINQSNCDRITCSLGTCLPRGRRKRELTHDLEVTVTVPDIPSTVEDSEDNNAVLDTANLLAGILESNPEEFSPNVRI